MRSKFPVLATATLLGPLAIAGCAGLLGIDAPEDTGSSALVDAMAPAEDAKVDAEDEEDAEDAEDEETDAGSGSGVDGGADAGTGFCPVDAGTFSYCMDFDAIDAAELGLGGSAAVVSTEFVSPPRSLQIDVAEAGSGGGYSQGFPFPPVTSRLEFQIRSESLTAQTATLGFTFAGEDGVYRNLSLHVGPDNAYFLSEYVALPDGGNDQMFHRSYTVNDTASSWHHVVMTVTINDPESTYVSGLTIDDQVIEMGYPLSLPWREGNVTLEITAGPSSASGAEFFIDNVLCTFGL